MLRKISFALVGFIICCFLETSTTHNQQVLNHYIISQEIESAYAGLWPAAKRGDKIALEALSSLAAVNEDKYWLERAAQINSLGAQLALINLAESDAQRLSWLESAAKNQHSPSQFELYLLEDDPERASRLLFKAAKQQYQPAVIALGKYLYEAGRLDEAAIWLAQAAQYDAKSRYKLARVYWQLDKKTDAKREFALAAKTLPMAKAYANATQKHKVQPFTQLMRSNDNQIHMTSACSQQLQFVATSLDSLVQAEQFAQKFKVDERFKDFPICINPVLWVQKESLKCKLESNRQRCDLSTLATNIHQPSFTHLVLFLGAGTAYVQHGVMHLDEADTYSVFVHELAHFVGFVDEYALSTELAQQHCKAQTAPNLIVSKDAEGSLYQHEKFKAWQDLIRYSQSQDIASNNRAFNLEDPAQAELMQSTQEIEQTNKDVSQNVFSVPSLQLGASRTCIRLGIETFKPSSDITFLEYHDTNNIPPIYLAIWKELLAQQHQEIAIAEHYYNRAFDNNAFDAAEHWASYLD